MGLHLVGNTGRASKRVLRVWVTGARRADSRAKSRAPKLGRAPEGARVIRRLLSQLSFEHGDHVFVANLKLELSGLGLLLAEVNEVVKQNRSRKGGCGRR